MSTIQKICTALAKNSQEKKVALDNRYHENHIWLSNEFELIMKMINQNPREIMSQVPEQVAATGVDQWDSKKRKSPETLTTNQSPDMKRLSADMDELTKAAGLPTDLNKLTKGQLIAELEKRDCFEVTIKNLKKDIVDALHVVLSQEYRRNRNSGDRADADKSVEVANDAEKPVEASSPDVEDIAAAAPASPPAAAAPASPPPAAAPEVAEESSAPPAVPMTSNLLPIKPSSPSKARKGSLMAEFRTRVNSQTEPMQAESDDYKSRIEGEFQARQNRHRESQVRKSLASQAPEDLTGSMNSASSAGKSEAVTGAADQVESMDMEKSADIAPTAVDVEDASTAASGAIEEDVDDEDFSAPDESEADTAPLAPADPLAGTTDTISSCKSDLTDAEPTNSSASAASKPAPSNLLKKPTNLMGGSGGASSFLDKPPKQTVVVPALEKARALKAAEEQKAAAKKREHEIRVQNAAAAKAAAAEKIAAEKSAASAPASAPRSPGWGLKKQLSSNNHSCNNTTAAAAAAPAVKKTGFMGMFSKNKDKEAMNASATSTSAASTSSSADGTTSTVSSAAKTVPAIAAPTTATKSLFDISVVDSKNSSATKSAAASPPGESTSPTAGAAAGAAAAAAVSAISTPAAAGAATSTAAAAAAAATTVATSAEVVVNSPSIANPLHSPAPVASLATKAAISKSGVSSIVANYKALTSGAKPLFSPPVAAVSPAVLKPVVSAEVEPPTSALPEPPAAAAVAAAAPAVVQITPAVAPASAPAPAVVPLGENKTLLTASALVQHQQKLMEQQPAASTQSAQPEAQPNSGYEIEDRDSSDSGSDTDGDDSEAEKERKRKQKESIPDWARGVNLKEALEKQYGLHGHTPMDPDTIFFDIQTCNLEEIFGTTESIAARKYSRRGSSACWTADELSVVEKRQYRRHMGYDKGAASTTSRVGGQ